MAVGLLDASIGAAAPPFAAADLPQAVAAVVSARGHGDFAEPHLGQVHLPTLPVIGSADYRALEPNCSVFMPWAARSTWRSFRGYVPRPTSFCGAKGMRIAVTGAYGFSGKYIARRLLDLQHEVVTLTNSPNRPDPFGGSVQAFPYNFSHPKDLERSLDGLDVLINTYWVRFDNPPHFTFAQAIANSKVLFDAAKRAGIRRIVHISITNPDHKSDLPYFSGKAELEDYIKQAGMSYAILRPAVLFGKEDILINNIAWGLRRLPVFGIYGSGRYRLQPIHVDDLAAAAVDCVAGDAKEPTDAIGPETFYYRDLVRMIAREIGSRALIVPMPASLAYHGVRAIGWLVGDVINTGDEVKGLMQEQLYVDTPPLGRTKLSDWVRSSRDTIGRGYASELERRLDRVGGYRAY